MRFLQKIVMLFLLTLTINSYAITWIKGGKVLMVLAFFLYIIININPTFKKYPTGKLKVLAGGTTLLELFLGSLIISAGFLWYILKQGLFTETHVLIIHIILVVLAEAVIFWNGIIRVYLTSTQLGMKWRIIGILCGWIPVVHLWALMMIIGITADETKVETEKEIRNKEREKEQECKTKYPLLMVHGVFFRDTRFFNYWGRIPEQLIRNGATVYYGNQQSAASVKDSGEELTKRIEEIIKDSGCEKVNVIAHSKGGLDCRYAISHCGANQYVASLTTINTPHYGCLFADYLLGKIPEKVRNSVADKYNKTLKNFGDTNPDFLAAVTNLTAGYCEKFNEETKDSPEVFYQSYGSKMNRAHSGKFPLNLAYPLVRHFDGDNDGLVSVDSAKWGEDFHFVSVKGSRGISHGDMIDLNRENIKGFDVRELYVNIVKDLKKRGL